MERSAGNMMPNHNISTLHEELMESLPKTGVSLIFAYGSGVFEQRGESTEGKMIDFTVVVDQASAWHASNLLVNPKHYSSLRFLGPDRVAALQTNFPAKVYYNTLVPVTTRSGSKRLIKYGVVETGHLIADLMDWEYLYIAGRLQKPTKFVCKPTNHDLLEALQLNLRHACHAALLLLPETFSFEQFYNTITSLSYEGDFRWYLAEDRNKISKIVTANLEKFQLLYEPIVRSSYFSKMINLDLSSTTIEQDLSPSAVLHHLELLPKNVQITLQRFCHWREGGRRFRDLEEAMVTVARDFEYPARVRRALRSIVFESSTKQTLKSMLTAGICKSVIYASQKFRKMVKSLR